MGKKTHSSNVCGHNSSCFGIGYGTKCTLSISGDYADVRIGIFLEKAYCQSVVPHNGCALTHASYTPSFLP